MAIVISTSKGEKVFNKDVINVGTNSECDIVINTGYDVLLTIQYNAAENKCIIMNTFQSDKVLFKGQPIKRVEVRNVCKLMFANSEEFLSVKILEESQNAHSKTITSIGKEDLTEEPAQEDAENVNEAPATETVEEKVEEVKETPAVEEKADESAEAPEEAPTIKTENVEVQETVDTVKEEPVEVVKDEAEKADKEEDKKAE